MDLQFHKIAIVGLGLIGSSIARAVRASHPSVQLVGYDLEEVRAGVGALDLVDRIAETPADAVREADLIVMCVPVSVIGQVAQSLAPRILPHAIVTDVGSSKALITATLRERLPGVRIVPAHPVAGSERSGPEAGSEALFQKRWCILTPDEHASHGDVDAVAIFWRSLGAKVEIMSAQQHDLVLAAISHVPHLVAFATVSAVAALEEEHGFPFMQFSAGGFRDFTRIAAANPSIWTDILISNKTAVRQVYAALRRTCDRLEALVSAEDSDALAAQLRTAQQVRRNLEVED